MNNLVQVHLRLLQNILIIRYWIEFIVVIKNYLSVSAELNDDFKIVPIKKYKCL